MTEDKLGEIRAYVQHYHPKAAAEILVTVEKNGSCAWPMKAAKMCGLQPKAIAQAIALECGLVSKAPGFLVEKEDGVDNSISEEDRDE